ncbi:hypothetical protein [Paenibacillus polymyxa]|uniref:Uncharacterized protein n=1 Tax=Paenibacillus polymyxa TaxID=1406 RepID=A0AAE9L7B3_PAEPO|nr:hypothetical protein [Paenibacillus polymyxa]URJ48728.1 hypothetical protein MF626_003003 [Paenibacillus polymyxa]
MYYISKILNNISVINNIINDQNSGKVPIAEDYEKIIELDSSHPSFNDLSSNQSTVVLLYNKELVKYINKYKSGYDYNDEGKFIAESKQLAFNSSIYIATIFNN